MLTITGASDDLIEIDGEIFDEFNVYLEDDETHMLAVSDGTLLGVRYDENGIWRFSVIIAGKSRLTVMYGDADKDTNDVVTLTGEEFRWVVLADQKALRGKPLASQR